MFTEVGYEVEVFSPAGGKCEADAMSDPNDASGYSKTDLISQGFIHTPELKALVDNTKKVADIDVARFDAIVVAGDDGVEDPAARVGRLGVQVAVGASCGLVVVAFGVHRLRRAS